MDDSLHFFEDPKLWITDPNQARTLVYWAKDKGYVDRIVESESLDPEKPPKIEQTIFVVNTKSLDAVRELDTYRQKLEEEASRPKDRAKEMTNWLRTIPFIGPLIGLSESLGHIVGFVGGILGIISIVLSLITLWLFRGR
jgi:hypothetical protein